MRKALPIRTGIPGPNPASETPMKKRSAIMADHEWMPLWTLATSPLADVNTKKPSLRDTSFLTMRRRRTLPNNAVERLSTSMLGIQTEDNVNFRSHDC